MQYYDYATQDYSHEDILKVITFINKRVRVNVRQSYKVYKDSRGYHIELDDLTEKQCEKLEKFEKEMK